MTNDNITDMIARLRQFADGEFKFDTDELRVYAETAADMIERLQELAQDIDAIYDRLQREIERCKE